jgi:chromosomal replication initiator protein
MMQTGQAVMMPMSVTSGCLGDGEHPEADAASRGPQGGTQRPRTSDPLADVLRVFANCIGTRSFAHWFGRQVAFAVEDGEVVVRVASPFFLNWMQKQFRAALLSSAASVLGASARVRFEVDGRLSAALEDEHPRATVAPCESVRPGRAAPLGGPDATSRTDHPRLSPERRREAELGDFIEGDCNRLALTAALQVADAPGARFNPLYLHGGVGLGKTHLLEGVHRRLRKRFPALRVLLLTAEMFANHFTEALRAKTLPAFRQRFRSLDVMLVDDVDFFDGKRVIQEEFLHTFKHLESQHKQLLLTADRHPRLLLKSSDELTTRFLSGMVCRIEPPDAMTRRKIVGARAARLGVPFAEDALDYVAGRFRNTVRELEGAMNSLATWHAMTGRRISASAARRVLADLERDCIRIIQPADVEAAVCRFFGVRPEDLRSPGRQQVIVRPRMLAMYLMRKHTQAAYTEIGRYFGGRNHATVMSAEKKVRRWVETCEQIPSMAGQWPADELVATLEQQLLAS